MEILKAEPEDILTYSFSENKIHEFINGLYNQSFINNKFNREYLGLDENDIWFWKRINQKQPKY